MLTVMSLGVMERLYLHEVQSNVYKNQCTKENLNKINLLSKLNYFKLRTKQISSIFIAYLPNTDAIIHQK